MNKKIIGTMLVATSMLTSAAFAIDSSASFAKQFADKNNKRITNNISLLFVQQAQHATLRKVSKNSNCYSFTVWPASKQVYYFSDEPVREAGELTTKEFIALWKHQGTGAAVASFEPNVAIEGGMLANGKFVKIYNSGATLSDVKYSAKHDYVTYKACPIGNGGSLQSADLRNVTVFMDDFGTVGFTPWPPS
jgi:hypothetical protein